jgi:hypothetical protein
MSKPYTQLQAALTCVALRSEQLVAKGAHIVFTSTITCDHMPSLRMSERDV